MSERDKIVFCVFLLCCVFAFSAPANAAQGKMENSCVSCHSQLPGSSFIGTKSHSWKGSMHQKHGVTCDKCHGGNPLAAGMREAHAGVYGSSSPKSSIYYKNIPSTCGKCHGGEFYKFTQSLHYRLLETAGKGPDCVTCHGSMVTHVLQPSNVAAVCERCHNDRMGVFPYIPQKARAVLLLLKESQALLDAERKLYHPARGSKEDLLLRSAGASLHSATLDWHKFDLDIITGHLQEMYDSLEKLSPVKTE